ncbi:Aste57867_18215 [Aphanomyces stellatus]|uniref:Aste57867_18215 protein n=1 Tax=Aphanomyces stellatus TaxID=120398 RepID=A0A485L9V3_9STRA|nr:hypothetical protein As57867_018153 [Aphanomyces stellatus]VFT94953.1 Aste57867_18215 [Aphanomyces stellatus]
MEHLLYLTPPTEPISLEDLEAATMKRMHLLLGLHRGDFNADDVTDANVGSDLHAHFGLRVVVAASMVNESIASQQTDAHEWLAHQEANLFRLRVRRKLKSIDGSGSNEAIVRLLLRLLRVDFNQAQGHLLIPFQEAPYLVRTRATVLKAGICHVQLQSPEILQVLTQHMRQHIAALIQVQCRACRVYPACLSMERLWPLKVQVDALLREAIHGGGAAPARPLDRIGSAVALQQIEHCVPMCMRHLLETLRTEKHLKYDGRNQLRLFLKGVGFTFDENMLFWREAFAARTSPAVFDKKYAYNVRHTYGLVGFPARAWAAPRMPI